MIASSVSVPPVPTLLSDLFAAIDRMDASAYAAFFVPNAAWKFGNAEPVVGRDAITMVAQGVFDVLDGIAHHLREVHTTPTGFVALGDVTYSRRDGQTIVLPFAASYVIENGKIAFYQTYMDGAPLFAGYDS